MNLLVYLTDGRTVYLLEKRSRLTALVTREPGHESEGYRVARGIWNPITGEYVWSAVHLRYIRKASISVVEEAPHGLADAVAPKEA